MKICAPCRFAFFASVIVAAVLTCANAINAAEQKNSTCGVQKSHFGNLRDGREIEAYTLTNSHGLVCKIINYGGVITELDVPDRYGKSADVVLGFENWQDYLDNNPHFGAICGRVANRISNARFTLDGHTYHLTANNGTNQIHGGFRGFDKVLWRAETTNNANSVSLRLAYLSRDGEEGFPGNLQTVATYTLTDRDELRLEFSATTDKPTPVNLSNHTYWNLGGEGEITNEMLTIYAERTTIVDSSIVPTGEIAEVKNSPLDFTKPAVIGSRLSEMKHIFDNNLILEGGGRDMIFAARLFDPGSGRALEIWTDQPAMQLYTGNFGPYGFPGKHDQMYKGFASICLEAQGFPDAVNHTNFPSTILRPGETYHKTIEWRFSTR